MDVILTGFAIFLLLEGLGPLLFPKRWQRFLQQLAEQPPQQLRTIGGVMVTVGLVSLLFLL